eukprot:365490-Chlamydomonas_euryale.AAC.3
MHSRCSLAAAALIAAPPMLNGSRLSAGQRPGCQRAHGAFATPRAPACLHRIALNLNHVCAKQQCKPMPKHCLKGGSLSPLGLGQQFSGAGGDLSRHGCKSHASAHVGATRDGTQVDRACGQHKAGRAGGCGRAQRGKGQADAHA